jgi:serine phosphatase RsbU (regulator of sigma subunit)
MKNLNESRREIRESEVVPFERRSITHEETTASLLPARQVQELRERWLAIQSHFVDDPRRAVEDADQLVASAIKQIEEVFAAERTNLEKQSRHGDDATTEDLRLSLQHYRDVFDRLLSR